MIEVADLKKTFETPKGPVHALDGISFVARPGEVFGLLGVNGAGKTTCLRILSTVLQADSGVATVNGHDVQKHPEKVRASIGFLSNSTALYGRLSGREVLRYFGGLYGMEDSLVTQRIEAVIQLLNLGEFIDRLCDKLSTGQKQRVSIARAILHDPPVLFFDEPSAGLDVVTAQTILEFIEDFRSKGKTIVLSTHIMSEVERLCDHVAVIHQGVIRSHGTVTNIKEETGATSLEQAFLALVGYRKQEVVSTCG